MRLVLNSLLSPPFSFLLVVGDPVADSSVHVLPSPPPPPSLSTGLLGDGASSNRSAAVRISSGGPRSVASLPRRLPAADDARPVPADAGIDAARGQS